MRTLTLREVGKDELPVDGAEIVCFYYGNNFEPVFTPVSYLYSDISDTLEEAIRQGGEIVTDPTIKVKDNSNYIPILIGETTLTDGMIWCYKHEYIQAIHKEKFPFQEWNQLQLALANKWIQIKSESKKTNLTYSTLEQTVLFNEQTFKLLWDTSDKKPIMIHYTR